jgi:hypothetical protein
MIESNKPGASSPVGRESPNGAPAEELSNAGAFSLLTLHRDLAQY